jgi:hypothetical protein
MDHRYQLRKHPRKRWEYKNDVRKHDGKTQRKETTYAHLGWFAMLGAVWLVMLVMLSIFMF